MDNNSVLRDLEILETCRTALAVLTLREAERVLKFLQDWNKTRPAEDK